MIFFRPVPTSFPVTQNFGENPDRYPKTHGHNGIDYHAPTGTKIMAAASGQVIFAAMDPETIKNPKAGYGMHVRIRHPNNVLTLYAHLSDPLVQVGDKVKVGQPIGLSDNTGFSDGPHLHFEVRTGLALQNMIDPAPFMTDTIPNEDVLYSVEVTPGGNGLRVRRAPTLDAKVLKNFKTGDVIQVLDEVENHTWLRILDGFILNNPEFIKRLDAPAEQSAASAGETPVKSADNPPADSKPVQTVETLGEPVLYSVRVTQEGDGLRVRKAPNTDGMILFNLRSGDMLEVLEEIEDKAWLRVRDGFIMNKPEWLERVQTAEKVE